jgi:hypothetical protein
MQRDLCGSPGVSVVARCDATGTLRLLIKAELPPSLDPRLASPGFPVTVAVWLSDVPNGSTLTSTGADSISLGGSGSNLSVATAGKAVSVSTDSAGRAEVKLTSAAKTPWFLGVSCLSGSVVSPQLSSSDFLP